MMWVAQDGGIRMEKKKWVLGKTRKKSEMRVEKRVFKTRLFQLTINKRHAMRKKAGKIHENIWKDHKMLPIFTTTMCERRWRGKNYLFATEQSTFSASSPHACRHKMSSHTKILSSSFANGIWHLTHFSVRLSPTAREMEMPQQLRDKWWTNMIRNGNYAIANFRILRIFVHVLLHLPCGIFSRALCRMPVGGCINKLKSLNFMETLHGFFRL